MRKLFLAAFVGFAMALSINASNEIPSNNPNVISKYEVNTGDYIIVEGEGLYQVSGFGKAIKQ